MVKKKVKVSLYLIKHYALRTVWGNGCIAPPFLALALDEGEWSASRPGRFTLAERVPGTHWIRGWVAARAGLDSVEKRKILSLLGIEPWPPSPSLYRLSYPGFYDLRYGTLFKTEHI
jgi:hypothetical protein